MKARATAAGTTIGIALVLGVALVDAPAVGAEQSVRLVVTAPAISVAPTSAASDAYAAARSLRRDVATMLQRYLNDYGNRFTSSERTRLLGYRAKADRELANVVLATQRLDRATTSRAPSAQRRAAGAAAQSAWRRAKATADSSFASARQILEPKLSIVERLGAGRDYSMMMGRFDDLGAQIDVAAAQ